MILAAVCFTDSAFLSEDAGPGSSYVASLYLRVPHAKRVGKQATVQGVGKGDGEAGKRASISAVDLEGIGETVYDVQVTAEFGSVPAGKKSAMHCPSSGGKRKQAQLE